MSYLFPIPSNLSGQSSNLHNSPFLAEEIESQRGKEKWPQSVKSNFSHRDQEIVGSGVARPLNFSLPSFPHCNNSMCTAALRG